MRFKEVELKDICLDMHQGINTVADKVEYQNEGVPIIQSKNITSGYLDLEDVRYLDDEAYLKYKDKYSPQKGDILLCNIGTIGTSLVLNQDNKFLIAWNLFKLKINKELYVPEYIKYYLEKLRMMNYFDRLLTGGTVKFINKTKMGEIKIPICNIDEQYRIAKILDKSQELIDKRKAQIEYLDELIKSKFIEMFGDPVSNPMNWEKKRLADECSIITGNTPSRKVEDYYGDYIEWIKSDNITNAGIYLTTAREYLSEKGLKVGRSIDGNSILMTCIAGSIKCIGNVAIANRKVTFNQQINGIEPLKNNVFFMFQQFNLSQKYIQSTINMSLKGILSKGQLSELEFIFPPIEKQNEFAKFFNQVDKLKFEMQESLTQLEDNFNSLMTRAFKGELFN